MIAALLLNGADAHLRPEGSLVVGARLCARDHAVVCGLRRIELAGFLRKPAILNPQMFEGSRRAACA
jgi:hypothetical protein